MNRPSDIIKKILRPFCVIDFFRAEEPELICLELLQLSQYAATPKKAIAFSGNICNKGEGLAKDVVVYLNMRRNARDGIYRLTRPVLVASVISAGESFDKVIYITDDDVLRYRSRIERTLIEPDAGSIVNDVYEVVLEYRDAFGNIFRTVHPKGVWQDDFAATGELDNVVKPNVPIPVFLVGAQSARTMADVPRTAESPVDQESGS